MNDKEMNEANDLFRQILTLLDGKSSDLCLTVLLVTVEEVCDKTSNPFVTWTTFMGHMVNRCNDYDKDGKIVR